MGESSFSCHPPYDGCCLNFPETIVVLIALIIVVQLGLKLAYVICYYLWYLAGVMFGMVVVPATGKPKRTTSRALSRIRASYAPKAKPSLCWSEEDVPRRGRGRKKSSSPSRRCLHCTLEPLKVTMNLQNENLPYRLGRRSYADYLSPLPPRYYKYELEGRPRPRGASAPSAYPVTRYRETGVGSSDPILVERRGTAAGTELSPYRPMGPGPEAEHPGRRSRSRRPAKVYIYPVHPQTPPGSRSSSPERPSRRRHHRRRRAITSSQEDQQVPEPRATSRRAREAEQQTTTVHYQEGSTNLAQGQGQTEPPLGKPRYYWSDKVSGADWVYQPMK